MNNGPLPVGSVVRIGQDDAYIMVIGYEPSAGDVHADYLGVVYPPGLMDEEGTLLFDADEVSEIVFLGYADAESEDAFAAVRRYRQLSREAAANVERLIEELTPERIRELRALHAPIELPDGFEVPEGYAKLSFE